MALRTTLFSCTLAIFLITILRVEPASAEESVPTTLSDLKARLETEMQRQHIAGMMMTIVNRDSILFSGGIGYTDIDKKTPVTEKHLFRGASITKLFVALGIMNLVKDGKLKVNAKLKDIAPEIPFENQWETTNPVTIEELMEHTTGFSDKSPFQEYNFTGHPYTKIESVKVFEDCMTSKWKPGERHSYSSVNYAILDYITGKVSGQPTPKYLQERVFKPLGMPYANVDLTDDGSGRYSKGYVWKQGNFQLVPHQPAFNAGYSSLNVSAQDFAHVLKNYLNDWKTPSGQFLSKDILEATETPHSYLSAGGGLKNTYAYGNEANELGGHIFRGHRGAIGGFLSAFLYNRHLGLGYAFALNTHNEAFYQFADQLISEFVLRNIHKPDATLRYPLNTVVVKPYLGYYRLSNPSQMYTGFFESLTNTINVEPAGNEMRVQILSRGAMTWQAVDKTGLKYKNQYAAKPQILFLKDSDNNPVITDGALYFKKTTALAAWASILFFAFSGLILISTLVFGVVNIFLFILKKLPCNQLLIRLSPTLATIGLVIILLSISQLFDHMREAVSTKGIFMIWSIGKFLYAIFTLLTLSLLTFRWKYLNSKVLKTYLILATLSSWYLFVIFLFNDWY
ncbi:serine hydrolase [Dyadobacter sp. 3J3]|uniref:serine hydrolase domain-containing protein n=1 Tax=Dyadobacter sp. 3J3 TaxID=2606600 RepID=UPI00135C70F5|nr:serine hydrolase domain-containing protein [Dyadobacter sp. 3J3]